MACLVGSWAADYDTGGRPLRRPKPAVPATV